LLPPALDVVRQRAEAHGCAATAGIRGHGEDTGFVILAGAGVSMLAPSSLPGWRDVNRAVVSALAARTARDTNPAIVTDFLAGVAARREEKRAYAPDFLAQLIEEQLGDDYFTALQVLDERTSTLITCLSPRWPARVGCGPS
jgi:hypothetical protein